MIGNYVIVRTYSAGVHAGTLVSFEGKQVELKDARRIWYWKGANTLHEIALAGVSTGSKISKPVPSIVLTEAIEIIPASHAAEQSLELAGWEK
jgi:hypothetical protein